MSATVTSRPHARQARPLSHRASPVSQAVFAVETGRHRQSAPMSPLGKAQVDAEHLGRPPDVTHPHRASRSPKLLARSAFKTIGSSMLSREKDTLNVKFSQNAVKYIVAHLYQSSYTVYICIYWNFLLHVHLLHSISSLSRPLYILIIYGKSDPNVILLASRNVFIVNIYMYSFFFFNF